MTTFTEIEYEHVMRLEDPVLQEDGYCLVAEPDVKNGRYRMYKREGRTWYESDTLVTVKEYRAIRDNVTTL